MNWKLLHHFIAEPQDKQSVHPMDTEDQVAAILTGVEGNCLAYAEFIGSIHTCRIRML